MKSVLETIQGGASYLEKRGISEARLNMEHLLAKELRCGRMELYTQFDRPLEEEVLAPLRESLKKRGEGIPLQHILGEVHFLGKNFICDSRGLIPRPETEELVEMVLEALPKSPINILDVGCGSGVIGLSIAASRADCKVTLIDISGDALELTRANANKLQIHNIEIKKSDLFSEVDGKFDLIVANLPYVPEGETTETPRELSHDPAIALYSGQKGMDHLERFIPKAFEFLKPEGLLALEIGHDQASQVRMVLEKSGFTEIIVHKDLSGIARFPFATHP
ncbi:MAG: peptide chain release factor N(5)-glutamine methyltransferase [Akkermansiaceae bacterium]